MPTGGIEGKRSGALRSLVRNSHQKLEKRENSDCFRVYIGTQPLIKIYPNWLIRMRGAS